MIDILVYLFSRYGDYDSRPEAAALARKLKAAGFEDGEISEAIDWLARLKPESHEALLAHTAGNSLRVWTEEEHCRLGSAGIAFVLFLESTGVLDAALRELIVDRVLALDETPVSLEKLKVVALMVLWSHERDLESLLVEELLAEPERVAH